MCNGTFRVLIDLLRVIRGYFLTTCFISLYRSGGEYGKGNISPKFLRLSFLIPILSSNEKILVNSEYLLRLPNMGIFENGG